MSYNVEIINNNLLPLPDALCAALGFAVEDVGGNFASGGSILNCC